MALQEYPVPRARVPPPPTRARREEENHGAQKHERELDVKRFVVERLRDKTSTVRLPERKKRAGQRADSRDEKSGSVEEISSGFAEYRLQNTAKTNDLPFVKVGKALQSAFVSV